MNLKKLSFILASTGIFFGARAHSAENQMAVTVYNNDLALVREVRSLPVKSGLSEIRFANVASQIDPTSVHFKALSSPGKISLLEQNYEYDLVNADKILSKYLGQPIQVFTKEGKMFEGKLLSSAGDLVLEKRDGGIQSLAKPEIQNIDFPKLPAGLITKPTLVWSLNSEKEGDREIEVNYLTSGISWHAEYVGLLDPEDKKISLSAWASIDNKSGAAYENAKLKLIAGDIHQAARPTEHHPMKLRAAMSVAEDAQSFEEKTFFEYHLYTLSRPATLKDNQIKQISLFPNATAAVKKIYTYDGSQNEKKVTVNIEWVNSATDGMGIPLPAGKIRVYKQGADKSQEFIGEDRIQHTPKDEKIKVNIGNAFDLVGERKQKETKQLGTRAQQNTVEIKLSNRKETDVEINVIEHFWGEWDIIKSTHKHIKKDANAAEFKIPVNKNGETILEYTVTVKW